MTEIHREIFLSWTCIATAICFAWGLWKSIHSLKYGPIISVLSLAIGGTLLFSLLFWGAQGPLCGGQWDSQFVMAAILRVRTGAFFSDMYYPDLPSFYPPLYAWVMGFASIILGISTETTTIIGAVMVPSVASLVLFMSLRKSEGGIPSVLAGLFFILFALDPHELFSKPYEIFSIPLFLSWLFVFFDNKKHSIKWIFFMGLSGACIFMLYTYWFSIGFIYGVAIIVNRLIIQRSCEFNGKWLLRYVLPSGLVLLERIS